MIVLRNIYSTHDYDTLYDLLRERTKNQSISHKELPSWQEHLNFVGSHPYKAWYYIIEADRDTVIGKKIGSIYLFEDNFGHAYVGISIFKKYKGKGYASQALENLIERWPGYRRWHANINPKNKASLEFFAKQGFKHIQNTYVFER